MRLFFAELAIDLQSDDQELVKITLVKLCRIVPALIEDEGSYHLINRILRDISFSNNQEFADLAILVRDKLDHVFSTRESLSSEKFKECLKVLKSEESSVEKIYQAIVISSEYLSIANLQPYTSFLKNKNPLIRCAALEVYQYHSQLENLTDIVDLLNDRDIKVRRFVTRVLNRFGERAVIHCLHKMIDSNEESLKISAIHCLANLKTNIEIISMLKRCSLPGSEKVRSEAIRALKNHHCEETITLLMNLQNDLSIQICELAHSTLNNLEPSPSNKVLIREITSVPTQKKSLE